MTTGFIRALRSEKKLSELADSLEEEEKEQDELVNRVKKIEKEIEKTEKEVQLFSQSFHRNILRKREKVIASAL